jgi:isopenicillin-N epimerase
MLGSLAAVPLPDGCASDLQYALFAEHRIEVPVQPWPAPPRRTLRISAHLHNREEEYVRLADTLRTLLP